MRMRSLSNTAIALACILVIAHIGIERYHRTIPRQSKPVYDAGSVIDDTVELGLSKARRTLVLVTASTCHFCTASMPFYQNLVPAARQAGVRVVAVTAEEPAVNQKYLASHGVQADAVVSSLENNVTVRGTPMLMLLRSDGRVIASWLGKVGSQQEKEITSVVGARQD